MPIALDRARNVQAIDAILQKYERLSKSDLYEKARELRIFDVRSALSILIKQNKAHVIPPTATTPETICLGPRARL